FGKDALFLRIALWRLQLLEQFLGLAVLSLEQVDAIRTVLASGRALGRRFLVVPSTRTVTIFDLHAATRHQFRKPAALVVLIEKGQLIALEGVEKCLPRDLLQRTLAAEPA